MGSTKLIGYEEADAGSVNSGRKGARQIRRYGTTEGGYYTTLAAWL